MPERTYTGAVIGIGSQARGATHSTPSAKICSSPLHTGSIYPAAATISLRAAQELRWPNARPARAGASGRRPTYSVPSTLEANGRSNGRCGWLAINPSAKPISGDLSPRTIRTGPVHAIDVFGWHDLWAYLGELARAKRHSALCPAGIGQMGKCGPGATFCAAFGQPFGPVGRPPLRSARGDQIYRAPKRRHKFIAAIGQKKDGIPV
jgi:hypothetical protein